MRASASWVVLFTGLAIGLTATSVARAQAPSASEQMLAQSLFDEGRQLMDRGKYAEACPKLAESQRLDPAGGTLLNLAICHEKEGRFGTAYMEMKAASSQAGKEGRKDREKVANEHLAALAPRVPRLAVHVTREEPNLEVTVDGTVLRKPAWDLLTVLDPGSHVIDATAPGKVRFRQTLDLAEGEQRTVRIPALDTLDGSGRTSSSPIMAGSPANLPPKTKPETRTNPLFVASIVTGIAGFGVGVPAAYVWGMLALYKPSCTSRFGSDDGFFCASDGVRNAWLAAAIIGTTVGVVGTIGLAIVPRKIEVVPTANASGAGAVVVGRF